MKKIIFILSAILLMNACNKPDAGKSNVISVIPKPEMMKIGSGYFTINTDTKIVISDSNIAVRHIAGYFAQRLKSAAGFDLEIVKSSSLKTNNNAIEFNLEKSGNKLGGEGYNLKVTKNLVTINADKPAGLFYAVQTILHLLPPEIYGDHKADHIKWRIPAADIADKPHYSWRGMHLDVARHFFSKEDVKKYIDMLAMHKLNVLHLHLNDDQGWRIEIKKYPKLVEIGSKRADLPWNDWQGKADKNTPVYSGYYSQEDIKELVAYAQNRFITIVPEIEMPGHTLAALAAYPEYSCTGGPFTVPSGGVDIWKNHTYCLGNEKTYQFVKDILTEVMSLFPSKYIHIGGDETTRLRWENCPKCQARIKKEGLKDEDGLYGYFLKRIAAFLKSKNRIMIGWDEILEGGDIGDVAVMSWRGTDRVIKAVKRKLNVVVTPSSHLYFDASEKNGESRVPLQTVYSFNPVPDELSADEAKYILGAQACVWTENVTSMRKVEKITLPRMAALAEVVWTDKNKHNFEDFIKRMSIQYPRYEVLKLAYRAPDLEGGFNGLHIFTDSALVKFIAPRLNSEVRYTLDGSIPTRRSALYIKPFYLKNSAVIKAAEFFPNGKKGRVRSGMYEKQRPMEAVERNDFKPGLVYQYAEGKYDSTTQIKKKDIKNRGIIKSFIFPANHRKQFFAVVYNGFIHLKKDGIYYFYSESNDGSRLYIQDRLVVDHDGLHPAEEKEGAIALKAGYHPLRVVYFQNAGSSALKVSYKGDGIKKQEIPASVLFH